MAKECKHGRIDVDYLQWFVGEAHKSRWCPGEDPNPTYKVTEAYPDDVCSSYFRKATCCTCGKTWNTLEEIPAFLY